MLFEKLTEQDIERIDSYRKTFAGSCEYARADLSTILKYWNKEKAWMEQYFGDKLIVETPICYQEGEDELYDKVRDFLYSSKPEYTEFINAVQRLYPYPPYRLNRDEWGQMYDLHEAISIVTSTRSLVNNKIDLGGKTSVTLTLPNGEEYKVQDGAKPMRVLRKFAEVVGFKEFEEFRNAHSCCLQTKSLSGNLCLSIHPLDFMTMSDNECDWSSCMSWRDHGEYRLGTVEMMNSPIVICAYLTSDKNKLQWYGEYGASYEWNSKKWRCLFIVDHDNICVSVKSYPYYNSGLTKIAMKEIAKLFNYPETAEPTEYDYDKGYHHGVIVEGREVSLSTNTGAMYNDFGSTDHWVMLGSNKDNVNYNGYDIDYSGVANCMCCGGYVDWEDECADTLTCDGGYEYCTCCDERMHRESDDWYWVEGERVCECCCGENAVYDPYRGEYIWKDNARTIYLSRSNDDKLTDNIYDCVEACIGIEDKERYPNFWRTYFNIEELRYDMEINEYYVCPKDCTTTGLKEIFGFYGDTEQKVKEYMETDEPKEIHLIF